MEQAHPNRWLLSIDESGSFEGDDSAAVVGVLVRHPAPDRINAGIRETLSTLAPEIRWPLHATDLRLPLSLYTSWLGLPEELRARSPVRDQLVQIQARLSVSTDADAIALRQVLREEGRVSRTVLTKAQAWAQHAAPHTFEALERRAAEILHTIRDLSRALFRVSGAGGAAVIAAVAPRDASGDRYLLTLAALMERVLLLLGSTRQPHDAVRLQIAGRRVQRAPDDSVYLTPSAVMECVAAAQRAIHEAMTDTSATAAADVDFACDPIVDYRYDATGTLVLADYVANSIVPRLSNNRYTWESLRQYADRTLGMPITLVPAQPDEAQPISTIAPSDPWRTALLRALAGVKDPAIRLLRAPAWCNDVHDRDLAWARSLSRGAR